MGETLAPERSNNDPSTLREVIVASLRQDWGKTEGYQKFVYFVGFLLLASAVFHGAVLIVTGGTLEGDVSWRKPILFGESFGLTCISLAWVITFLPRRRVVGWMLASTLGLANFGEVFLVSMQQWRGVPSHFNNSTPFDSAVFIAMGFLIALTGAVTLVVTLLVFFALKAPPSIAWAIRVGIVLLVAGQIFGIPMIRLATHTFAPAGNMKVPHALSLHALQVLPVLAWLLSFANCIEARRTQTILTGAAGYITLVAVTALQAFSGRAPFDLNFITAIVLGVGVVVLAGAYARAALTLRHARAQARGNTVHPAGRREDSALKQVRR